MQQITLNTLKKMKKDGEKIAVLTCYDSTFSKISNQAGIDALLVGDTLGMVIPPFLIELMGRKSKALVIV